MSVCETAVHRALERDSDDNVSLSIHRSTAELVAALLDARAHGVPEEVTPTRAAELLGVSRPHVRRLMDRGELPFRMVGSHHRLPLAAVEAFRARERSRRTEALADLAAPERAGPLSLTDAELKGRINGKWATGPVAEALDELEAAE